MSFASKSRYLSGYYDDKALDKYFSEMSQPKGNDTLTTDQVTFIDAAASGGGAAKNATDSNKKFVMILSTNSDAVSEQIGAFAENNQILESIARLTNKGKIDESNGYVQSISLAYARNQAIIASGNQYIARLNNTDDTTTVRNNIVGFLQYLRTQVSGPANTTTIDLMLHDFQK